MPRKTLDDRVSILETMVAPNAGAIWTMQLMIAELVRHLEKTSPDFDRQSLRQLAYTRLVQIEEAGATANAIAQARDIIDRMMPAS
ncbi:hypothetical protein [Pelagibacterium halotolerans]|uniref:Uncharacterized protein n=1 Tax=Pelagibacterium halotolerans (strain DSM 22347 / JCM 15775 / CGMCC 1.7692 / B2) TaxID=1082931 RepID=G4RDZ4_PELHB|nr:hypothetical protein [Pelagibacterium halotolerans]AEQ50788.1 hypothetical protein KKY_749 [Pelagibacterium halotolerans B2]QJR19296.1 hypothetical protein HKM20_13120 [Pelagibacterium halotolerans]SDZ95857.1 hypothetical protein SAMN05428936_101674 [Pelagibacterium halotolerans]